MSLKIERNPVTGLYPPISPYQQGFLKVSQLHEVYYEESGNPDGQPVVFVHGGPGAGTMPSQRQFFNPQQYRIILFDQRGCGKSKPFSELRENTTWDLCEDIEKLRKHLNIKSWHVFGGSWGSTLALAYSQTFPDSVRSLVLRGIFLLRKKEIDWFYQWGASEIFPDYWEDYVKPIPSNERHDLVTAYYKRMTSDDLAIRTESTKAWSIWEGRTSTLLPNVTAEDKFGADSFADAFARIECHYFVNKGFFQTDGQLLKNVNKIRHIPAFIIQGRYDIVCPMDSAWALSRAWPEAQLRIIDDAGHSVFEKGITKAVVDATDYFAKL
jgi:proline iminopeptidase